jgi:hypoxanthine phosphoribosyltransferase
MPALTERVKPPAFERHATGWLGPPLTTLRQPAFDDACARLMRLVEADFAPTMLVGIRTGGLTVAHSMARTAATDPPVMAITCRRGGTAAKSQLPWLRPVLGALPNPLVDGMRKLEHRLLIMRRTRKPPRQIPDAAEAAVIAAALETTSSPRLLIADDAVDSGVTLLTVLGVLRALCPPGTEFRTAAITQTHERPAVKPDYVLYHGVLCRFPWSFDAARR